MRKLIAAAMVLLVLALGVVNFPLIQSVVTGTPSLGSKDRDSLSSSPSPTPQEAGTGSTATSSHDAVASFSTEEAAAVLARLKPRPSQGSVGAHEVPVQLPRKISIPSIAVETGFEHVGLLPDGAMDVPKDPNLVAWYRLGPRPGEAGNAVVAGHVDWGGKTAAFWRLSDLKPGDLVEITAVDERKYQFVMQWRALV